MLRKLDGKIRHSFSNSILSILSAFLWEIEAFLLPKKNFLLKYASHKYKMRNKGSEIPLFPKISNILMLKMCLSGCSFCALLWHSILFPEDAKYWMPRIIPVNKCVCDFYHIQAVCSVFVDMKDHQMVQSAVRSGRMEIRFYPLHRRKWSPNDCISSRHDKENFCLHNDLGYKSLRCCT